ncbi:MAG: ribonuclease HII [Patescibacteria group bacterium]
MPKPPSLPKLILTPKFSTEVKLRQERGIQKIVGVDEVGRGALAGPLIVCAIELTSEIAGINDSKLINPPGRVILCGQIRALAEQIRFGWATNLEIDELGLAAAQRLAYQRALNDIDAELVLTDNIALDRPHISKVRGDQFFYSVAAASIVAKTLRDTLMRSYHQFFPNYFWQNNAGYGTKAHFDAIARHGTTKLHRQSFL